MNKVWVSSIATVSILIICSAFFQKNDLPKTIEQGKEVYTTFCMNCHMEDGMGTPDIFPPLAKSDYLMNSDTSLINVILEGQSGEVLVNGKKYNGQMLAQNYLSDEQIADVLNYVRNSWGNKMPAAITPEQVKALRK